MERSVADLRVGEQEGQDGEGAFSGEDGGADSLGASIGAEQAVLPKSWKGERVLYSLSDAASEDMLHEIERVGRFTGISQKKVAEERTIPNFRPLLERQGWGQVLFESIKDHLSEEGLMLKEGRIVDASIIGVLSGVAMPAFLGQQTTARINAANLQARGLMSYCLTYFIDNGKMPDTGDAEYDRLSKDPDYAIITWTATRADNECKVNIKVNSLQLKQKGIFSIKASGDTTRIQATPAKG